MLRKVKCVKREVLVPLVRKPQGLTFQASPFGGRFFYLPRLYVSVQRNPGILPVGVDTRLIRAGAGRRQVGKPAIDYPIRALPEYVKRGAIGSPFCLWRYHSVPDQFRAIQASCQLVPIPGLFGLALAESRSALDFQNWLSSTQSKRPASWCRYPAYSGWRWQTFRSALDFQNWLSSTQSRRPASWCRYPVHTGWRWPTTGCTSLGRGRACTDRPCRSWVATPWCRPCRRSVPAGR